MRNRSISGSSRVPTLIGFSANNGVAIDVAAIPNNSVSERPMNFFMNKRLLRRNNQWCERRSLWSERPANVQTADGIEGFPLDPAL